MPGVKSPALGVAPWISLAMDGLPGQVARSLGISDRLVSARITRPPGARRHNRPGNDGSATCCRTSPKRSVVGMTGWISTVDYHPWITLVLGATVGEPKARPAGSRPNWCVGRVRR